ncbi:MAG: PLP-dependent aminotransferase family protein [Actinobacteria bacterium]|nr:PLP-dependent aminotransferase family protein [Actinomycetota bacterium]
MRDLLSHRAATSTSSAIRDLLRLTEQPGILSLAGGLPSAAGFPLAALRSAAATVLDATGPYGASALQYGRTEGISELRELVAARCAARAEHVVITTGSQQALDLLGRCLIDPGDVVVVESPSYVGALQALRGHGAHFEAVPGDHHGLDTTELERRLVGGLRPVMCYVVPNFANPTGATLPLDRREHLLALAHRFGFVIVEDDPYGGLRFRGAHVPAIHDLPGADQHVALVRSTSKTLAPGLRIGWAVLPDWLVDAVVIAKQAVDLHTPTLSQHLALALLADETAHAERIAQITRRYARQAEALQHALARHLGDELDITPADGGMFVWGRFADPTVDTTAMLPDAIAQGVAYVPGAAFHADTADADVPRHEVRLSFATLPAAEFDEAARRLAAALRARTTGRDGHPLTTVRG